MEWLQKNILQSILALATGAVLTGSLATTTPQQPQLTSTATLPGDPAVSETPEFNATP